ncbi:PilC/PilY family type IV pilus protein [Granulosicoccaceae sp. 1_MG-2023]|nr:PilC/PilY family type IV pilus protein [Granulosicoccaceae sp. 1_MG-2023]
MCASFVLSGGAYAEDIEIYGHTSSGLKPNVLFIVDLSNSMDYGTDGQEVSDDADRKLNIMRRVLLEVLADNADTINAGVLFFDRHTTGVRWPVSDINSDATLIDPTLPEGTTVLGAFEKHLDIATPDAETNYLAPLIEAAHYFRGDSVWINGYSSWEWYQTYPAYHEEWGFYENWYPLGANPAAYTSETPAITWTIEEDVPHSCTRYFDLSGNITSDGCGANEITETSCTTVPSQPAWTEYDVCLSTEYQCTGTESQGECLDGSWISVCAEYGEVEHAGYDGYEYCQYSYTADEEVFNWNGADYISPIADSCQGNYIVFLSDGIPTTNPNVDDALALTGLSDSSQCEDIPGSIFGDSTDESSLCVAEVVEFLATNDQVASVPGSVVNTFTIGFGLTGEDAVKGNEFLTLMANEGGGSFSSASDEVSLRNSLNSAIGEITSETDEFSALSIDSRNNAFSSDNRAFVNLFLPSESRSWKGNVKGYFIDGDGLLDVNGNVALDDDGSFLGSARSFWSDSVDGNTVASGGASEGLSSGGRTLLTYTGSAAPADVDLTLAEHALSADNSALTSTLLGLSDDTDRSTVLDWVQTSPMTDPLHSQPVLAKYAGGDQVLFTMTNQGFLHAFDASTPLTTGDTSGGEELFAFMPQALLPNLSEIRANVSGSHIYGLDGDLILRHDDSDSDKLIDSGETAIVYFGMRRGGRNYYAMDISDVSNPKLLWRIEGGQGDFTELGQSWSRPLLTSMRYGGNKTKVLIFGGGYDPLLDDSAELTAATMGRAVYVVNADSGALITKFDAASDTSAADMNYAIVSDLAVIDRNANGYGDTVYFGDTGGQVWRISFDEGVDDNSEPTVDLTDSPEVTKIGDFRNGAGTYSPRFFYPPAVALMYDSGQQYLAVTLGSGLRNNPLNTVTEDWVYMIKDPYSSPLDSAVDDSQLYDITDNQLIEGDDPDSERAALEAAAGWRLQLGTGEKSLSTPLIFDDEVHFTTFEPTDVASGLCSGSSSSISRYYRFSVKDGVPTDDIDGDDVLTTSDRVQELNTFGIPTSPTLVFPADGSGVDIYVDKSKVADFDQLVRKIYWKQNN